MESAVPSWPVKHNWRYIARETPPKRAAGERMCDFDEIYALFDEATARAQASRCINCSDPGCVTNGCPLANRIPEWLALTAEGRFLEAAAVSQSTSNMPEICSRVCRNSMRQSLHRTGSRSLWLAAVRAEWLARMNWRNSVTPSRFLKHKRVPAVCLSTAFRPSNSKKR